METQRVGERERLHIIGAYVWFCQSGSASTFDRDLLDSFLFSPCDMSSSSAAAPPINIDEEEATIAVHCCNCGGHVHPPQVFGECLGPCGQLMCFHCFVEGDGVCEECSLNPTDWSDDEEEEESIIAEWEEAQSDDQTDHGYFSLAEPDAEPAVLNDVVVDVSESEPDPEEDEDEDEPEPQEEEEDEDEPEPEKEDGDEDDLPATQAVKKRRLQDPDP